MCVVASTDACAGACTLCDWSRSTRRAAASSQTGIAVSNDATFALGDGAVTTAATLSGAGTVNLGENACLTVAGGGKFDGTLSGTGVLALSGGTLTKTDGSALAIDLAIADGFSFTTDANGTGLPVANTTGTLTLPENGTVTFDCKRADVLGKTFIIAKGGTVTKAADLLTGWNVVCTDATRKCAGRFAIKDGEFTVTVSTPGIMILVR